MSSALKELSYRRDGMATALRKQRNNVIGAVIPDVANPFYAEVLRGAEDTFKRHGFLVAICNADDDFEKQESYLDLLLTQKVSGVILAPSTLTSLSLPSLEQSGVAVVQLDRRTLDFESDSVVIANQSGAEKLTEYLLRSYERVAFLGGPLEATTALERQLGYRAAMSRRGNAQVDELIISESYDEHGGYRGMLQFIDSPYRPDAVLAANNLLALGALKALQVRSIAVDEIELASFDALPWWASSHGHVPYLKHPNYELGTTAAGLILRRLKSPAAEIQHVTLPAGNVTR